MDLIYYNSHVTYLPSNRIKLRVDVINYLIQFLNLWKPLQSVKRQFQRVIEQIQLPPTSDHTKYYMPCYRCEYDEVLLRYDTIYVVYDEL